MQVMTDIHNIERKYQLKRKTVENDPRISEHNKQLLLKYIDKALAGIETKKIRKRRRSMRQERFIRTSKNTII